MDLGTGRSPRSVETIGQTAILTDLQAAVEQIATSGRMSSGSTAAEATAYITCRRLGIDRDSSAAFSPVYIAGWMAQKGALTSNRRSKQPAGVAHASSS